MSETVAQLQAQDVEFQAAIDANTAAVNNAIVVYQTVEAQLATALAAVQAAQANGTVIPANVVADFTAGFAKLQASTAALQAAFTPTTTSATVMTSGVAPMNPTGVATTGVPNGGVATSTVSGNTSSAVSSGSTSGLVSSGGSVVSGGSAVVEPTVTSGGTAS